MAKSTAEAKQLTGLTADMYNLLVRLKRDAEHTRRFTEPADGLNTPSKRCLTGIEGDIEEFLVEKGLWALEDK
jgi:hypothetical protein